MNKTAVLVGVVLLALALLGAYVYLNSNGRTSTSSFDVLAIGMITNMGMTMLNLAKTQQVVGNVAEMDHKVDGRFEAQQEIAKKALEVIPPELAATIKKDALNPPPDGSAGVESQPQVSPRPDQPGSVTN